MPDHREDHTRIARLRATTSETASLIAAGGHNVLFIGPREELSEGLAAAGDSAEAAMRTFTRDRAGSLRPMWSMKARWEEVF